MPVSRLVQIERATLGRYQRGYSESDRRYDQSRGVEDGKAGLPGPTETRSGYRDEVMAQARADLNGYDQACARWRTEITDRHAALERQRTEQYGIRRDQLQGERGQAMDLVERRFGPTSTAYTRASERLARARDIEAAIFSQTGRPLRIALRWLYLPLLALIALAEIPINRLAFELFFSETPVLSLAISMILGIVLAFCAHVIGTSIRHAGRHERVQERLPAYVGAGLLSAFVVLIAYGVALIREHYVTMIEQTSSASLQALVTEDFAGRTSTIIGDGLGASGWGLLVINLLLLTVGAVAAFLRHDPHPDYEGAVRERERAERQVARLSGAYERRTADVARRFDGRITNLDRQIAGVDDELQRLAAAFEAIDRHRAAALRTIAIHIVNRLIAYAKGNQAARADGRLPPCLGQVTETEIIEELSRHEDPGAGAAGSVHRLRG